MTRDLYPLSTPDQKKHVHDLIVARSKLLVAAEERRKEYIEAKAVWESKLKRIGIIDEKLAGYVGDSHSRSMIAVYANTLLWLISRVSPSKVLIESILFIGDEQ